MSTARFLVISLNTGKVFEYDYPAEVVQYERGSGRYTVIDTQLGRYTSTAGGGKEGYLASRGNEAQ